MNDQTEIKTNEATEIVGATPTAILPADPMVSMIERIAMDPNVPIERLERMMDMKERMEDRARADDEREAKRAFLEAMANCQSSMPVVVKSQENTHTKSTYADLSDIEEQAMPVAYKHGFSVSFKPKGKDSDGNLIIAFTVGHKAGHSIDDEAAFPFDGAGIGGKVNKTAIQAFGSTATYARRYLLCMIFNISTGDDNDGNAKEQAQTISAEQYVQLRDRLGEAGIEEATICKAHKCANIQEFPVKDFNFAMGKLLENIANNQTENEGEE